MSADTLDSSCGCTVMVWSHEDFTVCVVFHSHGYILEREGKLKEKDLAVNTSYGSCVRVNLQRVD